MKKTLLVSFLLASSIFVANATPLYDKCASCHGLNGEKSALRSKVIKDMTKEDFMFSMKGYKDGSYGGRMKKLMKPQVRRLSDSDLEILANYIIK